jgi:hypothetical protein
VKEFFNGDIETTFKQALELGFDEQELSSFALQLTKIENTEVIKAYGQFLGLIKMVLIPTL